MVARLTREPSAEAQEYVQQNLLPTLLPALTALARARPEEPRTWLAEWLLANKPANPVRELRVELVLLLGLDVSGAAALSEVLVDSMKAEGRPCVSLSLSSLLKAEIASSSAFGAELSLLIQQGKMVPKASLAQLVKDALTDAPPGVYLLEGYPTSLPTLQKMLDDVGYAPTRAILLELDNATATAKFERAGTEPAAALQKMKSFNLHTRGMIGELEASGMLTRLDAALPPDALLAAATKVLMR